MCTFRSIVNKSVSLIRYAKVLLVVSMLFSNQAVSQDKYPNTRFFDESIGSPMADLDAVRWVSGYWRGEAWGGTTEEIWSQPLGGSMMASFKFVEAGKVKFYELITLKEENGSLILRLKHFDSKLKGWEEKADTVDFKLISIDKNRIYFDGYTFEKIGDSEMNVYVVIGDGEEQKETAFNFRRVKIE